MSDDLISRQAAIDTLNDGAELLRRVLDEADIVGAERAKYEWELELIESYISDMKELPSAVNHGRCRDCKYNPRNPRSYYDNDKIYTYAMCGRLDGGEDGFCSNYKPLG